MEQDNVVPGTAPEPAFIPPPVEQPTTQQSTTPASKGNTMNKAKSITLGIVGGLGALNIAIMVLIVLVLVGLNELSLGVLVSAAISGWIVWCMFSGAHCLWTKKCD
jgi:hypothetical protein